MCFESIPDAPRWRCDCLTGATNVYHSAAESSSRWMHCLIPFESWSLQNNTVPSFTLNICDSFREGFFSCHNKSNRYKKMSSILFTAAVFNGELRRILFSKMKQIFEHMDAQRLSKHWDYLFTWTKRGRWGKKKKEAIHQMCFTVQLILNAQFHISVDFLSLQEIGDAFFCHLVCFIFADMCKNRKMTHVLHCNGVLSSPCGTGARYWHDKRNKKMCSPTLYRTGILTTELRVNP